LSPEAFALLVASCRLELPAGITVDRLSAIALVESGRRVDAVSPPNRDGSRDFGIMQLNSQWIGKPGFPRSVAEALQPCPNIAAGVRILADNDVRASCLYNTGRPHCTNGYPARIQEAARRNAAVLTFASQTTPSPQAEPKPPSTETGRGSPGRDMAYR
jgi:hypothetical protein